MLRLQRQQQRHGSPHRDGGFHGVEDHHDFVPAKEVLMRVIIIGCGIAGLASAIALRRGGHDMAVYPRTTFITNRSWKFGGLAQRESRIACFLRDNAMWLAARTLGSKDFLKPAMFDVGTVEQA
jgi:hypothetical protein